MRKRPNASPKDQADDWDGFFQRLSVTPPNALTREDLESVAAFWLHLPFFLGTRGAVAVQDGLACFGRLCTAAEARGLDSAPLDRSASIHMRLADGPFSRRFACKPDRPSSWPPLSQSVNAFVGKPKPSAKDRRICQEAEGVVSRLMARPADVKALTPVELLALIWEQRKRTDGLYAEHARLPLSPRTRRAICGELPTLTCDVAFQAAQEAAEADPATYRTLPPLRGAEPLADLNNLELWLLDIMRKKAPGRKKHRRRVSVDLSIEERALAILVKHPDWSDTKIAQMVGCNRRTLYRKKRFTKARAILKMGKEELPHGPAKNAPEGDNPNDRFRD